MNTTLRIATRASQLARWQTSVVQSELLNRGLQATAVLIESSGDLHLQQPVYALGISGVFTKQLDIALLNGEADLAVHSLKDVPTQLAEGLCLAAVLERGPWQDVVVLKQDHLPSPDQPFTLGTGSLRRKAQWLSRFPLHTIEPLRGNVQTRLQKLNDHAHWNGAVFARAGLERCGYTLPHLFSPEWMLPAPAQGIIGIVCRQDRHDLLESLQPLNHRKSWIEGAAERAFMKTLQGGCSVPVSALAEWENGTLRFRGEIYDFDGSQCYQVERTYASVDTGEVAGKDAAEILLAQPEATRLMKKIRQPYGH